MVSPFVDFRGIRYMFYLMEHQLNLSASQTILTSYIQPPFMRANKHDVEEVS